ncbi:MAG TPA: methyltransferase domain-containing protein [Gaiellaceae bacterium]|jgi:ubiquinone/menaquinone biosynthesis C-methylase UbiE
MESRAPGFLAAIAAQARIEEIGGQVEMKQAAEMKPAKSADRAMWALGDYHRFARETVWGLGPVLIAACGISPGQRVLDVAAGTGNVAIRAAEAGARVIASDLTPENFEAGRREARERGVELDWVEADAEDLPFRDGEFDVVTSSFGAIFAPGHQAVANELVRVCRPGGTIGLLTFTPEGLAAEFFELFARFGPPPAPGFLPPILWGSEAHVRELFGDRLDELRFSRDEYVERAATPQAYAELLQSTFGPLIALRAYLADRPEGAAALDRELAEYATRANRGAPGGPAEYRYEYLVVVAHTRTP